MADRHDPKLSMRPPGERPQSDDPLVELAKVVSNRTNMSSTPAKPRAPDEIAQSQASRPGSAPLPSETDLARDLETELLNELQASFSMVPEVVGHSAQKSSGAVAPEDDSATAVDDTATPSVEPAVAPEELSGPQAESDYSLETPPSEPEIQPGRDLLSDDIFNYILNIEPETPVLSPQPQATQASPGAPPHAQQPPARTASEVRPDRAQTKPRGTASSQREVLANRIARPAQGGQGAVPRPPRAEAPPPARSQQRPTAPRPPSPDERDRQAADSAAFRPPAISAKPPVEAAVRPPRQPDSRWDQPSEEEPSFDPSRFAPLSDNGYESDDHGEQLATVFPADDPFFASGEGAFFEEAAPAEPLEAVPGYDDEALLPYPDDDLAAMQPRRSRRGLWVIAALLALVVIGTGAFVLMRSGGINGGVPPIISADAGPTKISPETAGTSETDSQSKLIYDRVDPGSEIADSQLVVTGNDRIADIPPIPDDDTSGAVSRVILEGGPAAELLTEGAGATDSQAPSNGGATTIASSAPEPAPIGPKKVRTVVVRPDGTIVSSEAVAPGEEPASGQDSAGPMLAELPPASETPPAPSANENPLLAANFGADGLDGEAPAATQPVISSSIPDRPAPNPAPAPRPVSREPTVVAKPGSTNGSIDVTPAAPPSVQSAGLGGGFLVQVSSQRSEAIALETFRELQRRYPSILGDRAPDIQRADLGERGIYYRVRVGYPTREQAITMCESLKAAGGDCLLATR